VQHENQLGYRRYLESASGGFTRIKRVVILASLLGAMVCWAPTPAAAVADRGFHGLTPARLFDSRIEPLTVDGLFTGHSVHPWESVDVTVPGRGGVPASGISAVALNITANAPSARGFLTVWPTGAERPMASSLNFLSGQTVANLVVTDLGENGQVSLFNGASTELYVIADVTGWFADDGAYTAMSPARLLDTRVGAPTFDGTQSGRGAVGARQSISVPIAGRAGVPPTLARSRSM
jgi:hypothetical protein